jgi:hypothetical protein
LAEKLGELQMMNPPGSIFGFPGMPGRRCGQASTSLFVALLILTALSGCAGKDFHSGPPRPSGDASFEYVPDPGAPGLSLERGEELWPPEPSFTPVPPYPESALTAGCPNTSIVIRIVIGIDGKVFAVRDSPLQRSRGSACHEVFRSAAAAAAMTWKFSPGEKRKLRWSDDFDGDGVPDRRELLKVTPLAVSVDVKFNFFLTRSGEGRVTLQT